MMRPFIPYRAGKRQPKPRVRSNFGCKNCLTKRVKCDEAQPECGRCVKAKVPCPGPRTPADKKPANKSAPAPKSTEAAPNSVSSSASTPPSSKEISSWSEADTETFDFALLQTVNPAKQSTFLEGDTLDRFLLRIVPVMGIFFDAKFFVHSIMPATQSNDQIFNATLAITAFHDLPMADIWAVQMPKSSYERYQNALKWYRKSVKQSLETPPDSQSAQSILIGLLTIMLYLGIELRQMNSRTQQGLVQAAFSMVYGARHTVRKSRNFTILLCMTMIMDFVIMGAANPSSIPEEQFRAVYSLCKQLCADTNATENYVLRTELYMIMYDVNIILDRGHGSSFELECRMQSWLAQLGRYESSLPMNFQARIPALRCRFLFVQMQVAWETYLYGPHVNRESIESRLSRVIAIHEINEGNTRHHQNPSINKRPSWCLEIMIIPSCVWVAWYWRSPAVYVRMRRLFADYQEENQPEQAKVIKVVLEFIAELASTPYHKPTTVELELLGHKPKVLQHWQSFYYIDHLLWKAGISNSARPSIPERPQIEHHTIVNRQVEVLA